MYILSYLIKPFFIYWSLKPPKVQRWVLGGSSVQYVHLHPGLRAVNMPSIVFFLSTYFKALRPEKTPPFRKSSSFSERQRSLWGGDRGRGREGGREGGWERARARARERERERERERDGGREGGKEDMRERGREGGRGRAGKRVGQANTVNQTHSTSVCVWGLKLSSVWGLKLLGRECVYEALSCLVYEALSY
jgi:hypothetical protein